MTMESPIVCIHVVTQSVIIVPSVNSPLPSCVKDLACHSVDKVYMCIYNSKLQENYKTCMLEVEANQSESFLSSKLVARNQVANEKYIHPDICMFFTYTLTFL